MSLFAHITQVQDPAHREALKEVARRLSAVNTTDPADVEPSLDANLNANGQRLTAVANPQTSADLVNLGHLRGYITARTADLYFRLRGLANPSER